MVEKKLRMPVARKFQPHGLLITALVLLAVIGHETIDLILSAWAPLLLVRVLALAALALLSIVFGLHLLNVYMTEKQALEKAFCENVSLQHELSAAVDRLKGSLELANLRNRQLQLTAELIELLHHCTNERELQDRLSNALPQLLPESGGCLYLDRENGELRNCVSWPKEVKFAATVNPRRCVAFREGKPQIGGSLHCHSCIDADKNTKPLSCFALGNQQKPIGILCSHKIPRQFDSQDDRASNSLLTMIQSQLELAIRNLRSRESLGDLAFRDALTGAFNRRYLEQTLEHEIARAGREKAPLALVMIDLDHFKQLNDTLGHGAGDVVLKALVKTLNEKFRGGDIVCRYGGEEFVVMMPGAPALIARKRADQVRREVHELSSVVRHQRIISVSMGLATIPDNATDSVSLLRAADSALYEAKRRGRDRVVIALPNLLEYGMTARTAGVSGTS